MVRCRARAASTPGRRCAAIVLAGVAVALFQPGRAAAGQSLRPRWEVGAGVAALSMPDYRGSDRQRGYLLPIPYVVYRGEVLKVDRETVSGLLFKSNRVELDVSLSGSPPVSSDGDNARDGMPDLAPTVEFGPRMDVTLLEGDRHRLEFSLPLRRVITVERSGLGAAGWVANPSLSLDIWDAGPGGGWDVGMSGGLLWADADQHDYFYGVSPEYATAGRPAYRARGGYSGAQLTLGVSKRFSRLWVGMFVRTNFLDGAVFAESPLVKERVGYLAGLAVSLVFAQSSDLVPSDY